MLGITSALAAEFVTGVGLREQWLDAPAPILFSFAIIAIASYIPILKGFTRYVFDTLCLQFVSLCQDSGCVLSIAQVGLVNLVQQRRCLDSCVKTAVLDCIDAHCFYL